MQSGSKLYRITRGVAGVACAIALGACFPPGYSEPETAVSPSEVPVLMIAPGGYPLGYRLGSSYFPGAFMSGGMLYSAGGWPIGYINPSVYGYGLGYGASSYYLRSRLPLGVPYYGERYYGFRSYGSGTATQSRVRVAPRPHSPTPPRAMPRAQQPRFNRPSTTQAPPQSHKR